MKKNYGLIIGLGLAITAFAQPNTWPVAIDPTKVVDLFGSARRTWSMVKADTPLIVDGVKDALWDKVPSQPYDRFIKYMTIVTAGVYSKRSMLSDGDNTRRTPSNPDDFSGTYRLLYDADYLYLFFDITDNEVNDGNINPGINESLELQEAPYADSAQDVLLGNPYPPYTGTAGSNNLKYCYWGYLGAFQIVATLVSDGKCNISFREEPDATKINYSQRAQACGCAWKIKDDGTGYTAEFSISMKTTLADSANNAFQLPEAGQTKWMALEMKVFDRDNGMKDIQASWNSEDNNVWDAMIYAGKLQIKGWTVGSENISDDQISFLPNPVIDDIQLSKSANVEIISIHGISVKSALNVNILNVSDLASGIYVVKINGKVAGKMMKL